MTIYHAVSAVFFFPLLLRAEEQQPHCGLWMAASTLGDATNLGMFAGEDIDKDVDIQNEIAIPLLFRNWDSPDYHDTDDGQLWDRYIWEGEGQSSMSPIVV
jgi:hypothetical protein